MEGGGAYAVIGPCIPFLVLNSLHLGEVYTWGDNDEGQLGDGTTNAIQRPRLVAALQGKKVNRVACGSAHTLAWSTSKPASAGKLPMQVGPGGPGGPRGLRAGCRLSQLLLCIELCGSHQHLTLPLGIYRGVHYPTVFVDQCAPSFESWELCKASWSRPHTPFSKCLS